MVLSHCTFLYVKFEVTKFYTLEVNAPDKNPKLKFTKDNNSKNGWNRVNTFEVMPLTRFVMQKRTGVQTDGQGDSSIPPKLRLWGYNDRLVHLSLWLNVTVEA